MDEIRALLNLAATCSLQVPHVNRPSGKERSCQTDRGSVPAYLEDGFCSITGAEKVCLEFPGLFLGAFITKR